MRVANDVDAAGWVTQGFPPHLPQKDTLDITHGIRLPQKEMAAPE